MRCMCRTLILIREFPYPRVLQGVREGCAYAGAVSFLQEHACQNVRRTQRSLTRREQVKKAMDSIRDKQLAKQVKTRGRRSGSTEAPLRARPNPLCRTCPRKQRAATPHCRAGDQSARPAPADAVGGLHRRGGPQRPPEAPLQGARPPCFGARF